MRQSVPADTELAVYTHLGEDSSSSLVLKQPNTVLTHTYQITGHARLYPEYPDYPKSTFSYSYTAYVFSYFFLLCDVSEGRYACDHLRRRSPAHLARGSQSKDTWLKAARTRFQRANKVLWHWIKGRWMLLCLSDKDNKSYLKTHGHHKRSEHTPNIGSLASG